MNNLFIQFFEENQNALILIKNFEHYNRIKYIDIQYYYIKEIAEDNLIASNYILISDIITDIVIKLIKLLIFLHLREKLNFIKINV